MAFLNMHTHDQQLATPIYNHFIDHYMPKANGTFVKVYLYGYRHCYHGIYDLTTKQIATTLDILESDVLQAWKYWEEKGLVTLHQNTETGTFDVQYLLAAPSASHTQQPSPPIVSPAPKRLVLETRPQYSTEEIHIYTNTSEDVQMLFQSAQKHLGKLLTFNDLSTLFSFYDWLRLPVDVIELLLKHCADNNHRNMRYIEKVAVEWSEKGIDTAQKAKQHIYRHNTEYREIMKAMGQSRRDPVSTEEDYMNKWLHVYKMSLDLIKHACRKTVLQTSQGSFPYADQILTSWYENHVSTMEDVQKSEDAFTQKKHLESQKRLASGQNQPSTPPRTNRFVNFEQREWDFDELKRLEREYIKKDLER